MENADRAVLRHSVGSAAVARSAGIIRTPFYSFNPCEWARKHNSPRARPCAFDQPGEHKPSVFMSTEGSSLLLSDARRPSRAAQLR